MAYTTIDDPSAHFQGATYTGNVTNRTITNDGNSDLQPDLIWFKNTATTNDNEVFDSTRGKTRRLIINSTAIDADADTRVRDFNTDGFDCGTDPSANGDGNKMVANQWKANGGSRTTNTESGNNPAGGYQANTTAGFSIIDYVGTGAAGTKTHGLGAVPEMIWIKNKDQTDNWAVYHSKNTAAPETDYLVLNESDATVDDAAWWNDTAPTSSVFTVNTDHSVNADGENYICYAWTGIQGYSKFGTYEGNGNSDGPFQYTGFKPRWVWLKDIDNENSLGWNSTDASTNRFMNPHIGRLFTDAATIIGTHQSMDMNANGFKTRSSYGNQNNDGATFIYAAFAHQPFVTSGGVPCTAR